MRSVAPYERFRRRAQLQKLVTKEIGVSIWQASFYDHIIRNEDDLCTHLQYIEENPKKWLMGKDKYYA